jgi:signal transduction histidine kinase
VGLAVPIVAGRRHPAAALMVAVAAAMAQTTVLTPATRLAMPLLGMLVAAFAAGRYVTRRRPAGVLLAVCLAEEWAGPIAVNRDPVGDALFVSVALWAVWLLGRSSLTREELAREEQARRWAGQQREQEVRAAVAAERQAVARDLHDTVAHAVTMMVLQATGTGLIAREQPESAATALASIEKVGRQAMDDLRTMLDVLRGDDPWDPAAAPAAPGPTLDDLAALVAGARDSGVEVTLHADTDLAGLPRTLSTTAYRTIQEGLTNAARHAPGAPVRLTVCSVPRALVVTVDNGPAPRRRPPVTTGTGTGLIGLRERVTALGGALHSGPHADGGFALSIELPRNPT